MPNITLFLSPLNLAARPLPGLPNSILVLTPAGGSQDLLLSLHLLWERALSPSQSGPADAEYGNQEKISWQLSPRPLSHIALEEQEIQRMLTWQIKQFYKLLSKDMSNFVYAKALKCCLNTALWDGKGCCTSQKAVSSARLGWAGAVRVSTRIGESACHLTKGCVHVGGN